jgi:hypothetical protein
LTVANDNSAFPLVPSAKRLAAFSLIGAALFAAPLVAERVTLADATNISAIAREGAPRSTAPVAASARIATSWELEARRSRDMAERNTAPARLERIPPRIMLALR